jgi:bla regulator protein BlaR1
VIAQAAGPDATALLAAANRWLAAAAHPVANHLWQSTVFAAIAAALALALRKNQARARYWIWMSASVKMLLPFALLASAASHWVKPRAIAAPARGAVYTTVEEFDEPFTPAQLTPITHAPVEQPRIHLHDLLASAIALVWFAGFATVVMLWAVRWRRVARAMRDATPLLAGREVALLRRMERAAGVRSPITLLVSSAAMEPGVFGVVWPVLAWPAAISARLDDAQLEAVLAHEVCHVRRRDNLTAALHMLVEAMFWFHPVLWAIGARLVEERERACDEQVLAVCGRPAAYAESILKVCEYCVQTPLECVSGVTGADLKQRVIEIMSARAACKLTMAKKLLIGAVGGCVLAVPFVLGQAQAARRLAAMMVAPPSSLHPFAAIQSTRDQTVPAQAASDVSEAPAQDQSAGKPIRFDIVSIRRSRPGSESGPAAGGMRLTGDGLQISNMPLSRMLSSAYQYQLQFVSGRILGLPDWAKSEAFDVQAKVANSDIAEWSKLNQSTRRPDKERRNLFLLLLLTEQFKLKTHTETGDEPMYALVVAKGGPKLKPSTSDERSTIQMKSPGNNSYTGTPLETIVQMCAQMTGRKVVDKTGLAGKYDFALNWTQYEGPAAAAPGSEPDASEPPVFTVVQDQLGLKLESQKGPVEYIVVDHAEKPESMDGAEVVDPAAKMVPVALAQGKRAGNGATEAEGSHISPVAPMAADAHPAFAVATIKPHDPDSHHQGFNVAGDRFIIRNEGVVSLMMFAYAMDKHQIVDMPDWVDGAAYDIEGTVDTAGEPNLRQQQEMIRKLLADRFQLRLHRDKRELSVYAIRIAKGGPKLIPAANPAAEPDQDAKSHGTEVTVTITSASVADFILGMQFFLDRPLVDQTGLTGRYDFSLRYTYDETHATDPDAPPGKFTAIQEQLGLKLDTVKGPDRCAGDRPYRTAVGELTYEVDRTNVVWQIRDAK